MSGRPYTVTDEQKRMLNGVHLLQRMVDNGDVFPTELRGSDQALRFVLHELMFRECVDVKGDHYELTETGQEVLAKFRARYNDFLNVFDMYCAVDLAEAEFAFSRYFDGDFLSPDWDPSDEASFHNRAWREFLNEERWYDVRLAVVEYKNHVSGAQIDPVEIVFMSFLREGRFEPRDGGWSADVLFGPAWDEIVRICNSQLSWKDLAGENGDEEEAEEIVKAIIEAGTALAVDLDRQANEWQQAQQQAAEEDDDEEEYYTDDEDDYGEETVVTTTTYYEPVDYGLYYDPFYWPVYWVDPYWYW